MYYFYDILMKSLTRLLLCNSMTGQIVYCSILEEILCPTEDLIRYIGFRVMLTDFCIFSSNWKFVEKTVKVYKWMIQYFQTEEFFNHQVYNLFFKLMYQRGISWQNCFKLLVKDVREHNYIKVKKTFFLGNCFLMSIFLAVYKCL